MKKIYADTCNKIVADSIAAQNTKESAQHNQQHTQKQNDTCDGCANLSGASNACRLGALRDMDRCHFVRA